MEHDSPMLKRPIYKFELLLLYNNLLLNKSRVERFNQNIGFLSIEDDPINATYTSVFDLKEK